ncbi:MAG: hypothetical protein AVDCRST_MAG64-2233, partial [uncultured Phycisphaerae bacterium]
GTARAEIRAAPAAAPAAGAGIPGSAAREVRTFPGMGRARRPVDVGGAGLPGGRRGGRAHAGVRDDRRRDAVVRFL